MIDLMIHLETRSSIPLYMQIYQYFKQHIEDGNLSPGEKLPSTRLLAKNLQISRSTVDVAYEQLTAEGYLDSIPCSGYYVASIETLLPANEEQSSWTTKKIEKEKIPVICDFTKTDVDLDYFPIKAWRRVNRKVYEQGTAAFQSGNPLGEVSLREEIAQYLYQARNVNCKSEQIIIGASNEFLLFLLIAILGNGITIAMENPTYIQAYQAFRRSGCQVNSIPMDEDGLQMEPLLRSRADTVYVMPSHQFPMGIVMPLKRRLELLKWANSNHTYIIEDDYDSEFRYKGKPIPSLQGYDDGGRVIYLGTFSKSIAPSIRVSYMVLPEQLLNRYKQECGLFSTTVSKIQQETISEFLRDGSFQRNLNKMRKIYKAKRDILIQELRNNPNLKVYGEEAGLHMLIEFPYQNTEGELVDQLAHKGILVKGLLEYSIPPLLNPGKVTLVLNYGHLRTEEMIKGIRILLQTIQE